MKNRSLNLEDLIRAVQKTLGVHVDGRAGPQTWQAIHAHIVAPTIGKPSPSSTIAPVDGRSEKYIATLLPEVQSYARALLQKAAQSNIGIRVISGTRTWAEQDALYAMGRTQPGPKVTNARGGHSNHNFGIAFDIGVFEGSKYVSETVKYKAVGAIGLELGLEWGGDWKSTVDLAHFQLRPVWAARITERQMLAELRRRQANSTPVYAETG